MYWAYKHHFEAYVCRNWMIFNFDLKISISLSFTLTAICPIFFGRSIRPPKNGVYTCIYFLVIESIDLKIVYKIHDFKVEHFSDFLFIFPIKYTNFWVRIRPFPLYFDLPTLPPVYFELCTSTFCQIWVSYWSRSTERSKVLVEVKFGQKGRSKV